MKLARSHRKLAIRRIIPRKAKLIKPRPLIPPTEEQIQAEMTAVRMRDLMSGEIAPLSGVTITLASGPASARIRRVMFHLRWMKVVAEVKKEGWWQTGCQLAERELAKLEAD